MRPTARWRPSGRDGLQKVATWVAPPLGEAPVAIERPTGLLVDPLVEEGFGVLLIDPNAVVACRPRYQAVSAKSDPEDAYILADMLHTDGHRFCPV